jgi:hypothetical protein
MAEAGGVLAGVPVGRGVATARAPAGLTRSQMHSPRADMDALLNTRAAGCVTVSTASMCEHPPRSVVIGDLSQRRCTLRRARLV